MIARILGIVDQNSLVQMILKKESGMLDSLVFDHRMYAHLREARPNLVGRRVEYDEKGTVLRFLKEDEGGDEKCGSS